jgi:hypothetical protein
VATPESQQDNNVHSLVDLFSGSRFQSSKATAGCIELLRAAAGLLVMVGESCVSEKMKCVKIPAEGKVKSFPMNDIRLGSSQLPVPSLLFGGWLASDVAADAFG